MLEVRVSPIRKTTPGRLRRSEAVKKFNGRDALLRVRDGKPNTDAEHRVPTESGLQAQTKVSQLPFVKGEYSTEPSGAKRDGMRCSHRAYVCIFSCSGLGN